MNYTVILAESYSLMNLWTCGVGVLDATSRTNECVDRANTSIFEGFAVFGFAKMTVPRPDSCENNSVSAEEVRIVFVAGLDARVPRF